jgi:hypothetical protein
MTEAGAFQLDVRAQGKMANGQDFAEEGTISLRVRPADASAPAVTTRVIDEDQNGLLDALEVDAEFNVLQMGDYAFQAVLCGADNTCAGPQQETRQLLEAGARSLKVVFDAKDLRRAYHEGRLGLRLQLNGPGGQVPIPQERISLTNLPPPETAEFRLTGEFSAFKEKRGTSSWTFHGDIPYFSPGGLCRWSGALAQETREFPISGEERTSSGENHIFCAVSQGAFDPIDLSKPFELRLATLQCNGRKLRAESGAPAPYLAVYPVEP